MPSLSLQEPLSENELDRLQEFFEDNPNAMNLEEMDGFFCALIAGPEVVLPSEYLPEVLGDTDDARGFASLNWPLLII